MNIAEIKMETRRLTATDSVTYTDDEILRGINEFQKQIIVKILRSVVDRNSTIKEAHTDTVAYPGLNPGDNGYNGEYAFPGDLLKPVRVEIKYSALKEAVPAYIYDINENTTTEFDQTYINQNFSQSKPYVRFERDSYFIKPLPTEGVTGGLHVWYEARQADLSEDTEEPATLEDFHEIYPYKLAVRYGHWNQEVTLQPNYREWKERLKELEEEMLSFYKNKFKRNLKITAHIENYA